MPVDALNALHALVFSAAVALVGLFFYSLGMLLACLWHGAPQPVQVQAQLGAKPKPPPGPLDPQPLVFPPLTGTYEVVVTKIYDGDTIHFNWQLPDKVRFHGINAPELRGESAAKGKEAKDYLTMLLPVGTKVTLVARGREKYGRLLADIHLADGTLVNKLMIDSGYAVPYLEDR